LTEPRPDLDPNAPNAAVPGLDELIEKVIGDANIPGLETVPNPDFDPNNLNQPGNTPTIPLPDTGNSNPELPDVTDRFENNEERKKIQERKIDEYLKQRGETVSENPLENQAGQGRQGDRYVNGRLTEYKTVGPEAAPKTIYNRVNSSATGGGQAPNVIIDARNSNLTREQIIEGLEMIQRSPYLQNKIDNVRVIGNGFEEIRDIKLQGEP
jgi:hypothetical protein